MASVVVSEIPANCSASELREYFEQEAGCVDSISYLLHPLDGNPRQAIVAFRDSTAATYVAKCTHQIGDATIVVTLRPREMFTRCVVQVDSLVLVTCTPHTEQCLKAIERDLGVKVDRSSGGVTLTGALAQIESANYRLQNLWQHQVTSQERELEMIDIRESHDQNIRGQETERHQTNDQNDWGLASTRHRSDDENLRSLASTRLRLGDLSLREAGFLRETISSDSDSSGERLRARSSAGSPEYSLLSEASRNHGARVSQRDVESALCDVSPGPLQSEDPFAASATCRRSMPEVLIRAIGGPAFDNDHLTGQRHQRDTVVLGRTPHVAWMTSGSQDYQCMGEVSCKPVPRLVTEPSARTSGQDASSGSRFNGDDYHSSGDDFHRSHDNDHNRCNTGNPSLWHDMSKKQSSVPYIATLVDRDITAIVQKIHARELVSIESDLHVTFTFEDIGDETRVVTSLPRPFDMLLQNLDIAQRRLDDVIKLVGKERFYYNVADITPPQVEELVSNMLHQFNHLVLHIVQQGELLLIGNRTDVSKAVDMLKTNIALKCRYPAKGATRHHSEQNVRSRANGNGHNVSKSTDHLDGVANECVTSGTEPSMRKMSSKGKTKTAVSKQHSFRTGDSLHSKIPTKLYNPSVDVKKQSEEPSGVSHKSSNDTTKGGNQFHFSMGDNLNVIICDGDIAAERVDVIVSAANGHLANYSGVAGAISRAAGRQYERDCIDYVTKHGPLSVTAVVPMAASGPLTCRYVLHAVGPMWNLYIDKNRCSADLRRTFYNCLCAGDDLGALSIALPAISTGIYHVPTDVCAQSLLVALQQFASERTHHRSLETVRIVNLNSEVTEIFAIVLEQLLSVDGRTISRVDSTAPAGANGHLSHRRGSSLGLGDRRQGVGDTIVSSSESCHSGSKSVVRQSFNTSMYAEKSCLRKSRSVRADDEVKVSQQMAPRSRPLSVDRRKERHVSRRRCTSLDQRRRGERLREEPWCRTLRDNHKSHTMHPHASEQISKTLRQTLSHRKTSSSSVPVRPSKVPKKKILDSSSTSETDPVVEKCPICLDAMVLPKTLQKCGHRYCSRCIDAYFRHGKPICPLCGTIYGTLKGNQPEGGTMSWRVDHSLRLPGFVDSVGAIVIKYTFPGGIQQDHHPNPGRQYSGIERQAFLPNNLDGREVVTLLKKAFDAGLVFTISDSHTTGCKDVITWNDIHHKTSTHGGSIGFGYPDPMYIQRVKEELATKGITSQDKMKRSLRCSSK